MSFSNPRRRMTTRSGSVVEKEMALKNTTSLQKGATFHSPSSPRYHNLDEDYLPPRLARSQSQLDDVIDANSRRMVLTSTIDDINEALANTFLSESKQNTKLAFRDISTPVPRGLFDLPVVDPAKAKEQEQPVLRPRSVHNRHQHCSDSGLGSSLASTNDKACVVDASPKHTKTHTATRTAAASNICLAPPLSRRTVNRIYEHILRPLLEEPSLEFFETIMLDIPRLIRSRTINCLRDVEKNLIFKAPEKAKSAARYLHFCRSVIRCLQTTVDYVPVHEQVRPGDRPYTGGYHLDLTTQVLEYARLLATQEKGDLPDEMQIDKGDDIRLFGGITENGRPAELVRVKKDGTAFSMSTGKPVDLNETPVRFKRSLSEELDDEEEIMRSMARRKKNATPEELAPKKCREPGCTKEFKRPCDLTKHEKTHSRPWKCPIPTCKYHKYGWPTQKEMDRHLNDKHSDAPAMHECYFKPCPYKSKRESNCKQHMEKAHGWTYIRTKSSGNKKASKPINVDRPAITYISPPNTTPSYSLPTPPRDASPPGVPADFLVDPGNTDFLPVGISPRTLENRDLIAENHSPSSTVATFGSLEPYQTGPGFLEEVADIYAARMLLPEPPHVGESPYNKAISSQIPNLQMTPPTTAHEEVPTHFSPAARGNAMAVTLPSLHDVDDDGCRDLQVVGGDFDLSDNLGAPKMVDMPLFSGLSFNLAYGSQEPEFFAGIEPQYYNSQDQFAHDYFCLKSLYYSSVLHKQTPKAWIQFRLVVHDWLAHPSTGLPHRGHLLGVSRPVVTKAN
ncbi:Zinc C2H2-type DNA-binding [Cordyceps militaris]|uniref:Zinc C2H2-type DNA-binding n=1 Tax=Cordyceps militaris TaxID=73501 RepID=A0A2H4S9I9_CORMI|nr:Zinc C2H2-type DNA-binding [Cordyceps militaris]